VQILKLEFLNWSDRMKKIITKKIILVLVLVLSFSIGLIFYRTNNSNKSVPKKAKFVNRIVYMI
jgi:hypothetical protein